MKRIILIKEGSYNPNLFADFSEFINNDFLPQIDPFQPIAELAQPSKINIGFFNKADNTFRLMLNKRRLSDNDCIAISHYANNLFYPNTDPAVFNPLKLDQLCTFADEYGGVVYGVPLIGDASDDNALTRVTPIVRDRITQSLKDANTGEDIETDHATFVPTVAFFGLIKVKNLPIYYLITDSRMMKIGGGLDISNDSYEIRMISDHDGLIKNSIITPHFSDNVTVLPNNNIYVTGQTFTLDMFGGNLNILKNCGVDISNIIPLIKSNLSTTFVGNGRILIELNSGDTGYLIIKIPAGLFLDAVSTTESLELCYSIFAV